MYIVYAHIAKDIEGYAYIGSGTANRPYSSYRRSDKRHAELIDKGELEVKVLSKHNTKEDAFIQERHMIKMHSPFFNKFMYRLNVRNKPSSDLSKKEVLMRKKERIDYWAKKSAYGQPT